MTRKAREHNEQMSEEQTASASGTGEEPDAEDIAIPEGASGDVSLADLLEAERVRADQEHDRYLRALAEFSNYRRRQEEQAGRLRQAAARDLILKLLNVVDDFERALKAADESSSFEALHNGLELTERKLRDILASEGVEPIEAEGQQFDPLLHEAVMRVEDSEHEDNTVVAEMQKGYTMGGEVLRPSRVMVAMSQ